MRLEAAREPRAATLVERLLAYAIDALVTLGLFALAALGAARGDLDALFDDPTTSLLATMLFLTVPFAYFVLAEGLTGTTAGKHVLRLAVVDEIGAPCGLYRATVRNVLRLGWEIWLLGPFLLALDLVLIQLTERDQRLGDAAAGTRVLRVR